MDLSGLLTTFANNLLPILLVSGAGFLLGKTLDLDSRTLGRVVFYVFSPILVFDLLLHTQLSSREILTTMLFAVGVAFLVGLIAFLSGRVLHLERPVLMALIITAAFGNTGNYGLPLVSFAFGQDALAFATVNFVTSVILFNTAGVFIASLGKMNLKTASLGIFRVPAVYAVILAAALNRFQVTLPVPLDRTIALAANGSIPLMLVLLGLELSKVRWEHGLPAVGLSAGLRLLGGAAAGFLLAAMLGFKGAMWQGNVIESAMPAAVTTTVLATEYGLDTSLVTAMVFLGTILSPLTLTPLLLFLSK
ncbi:MAG TPA: AEC family transporter [Anaerolineales bacterium]|nr:AEC family transporter [Anaerolineales bacterium]